MKKSTIALLAMALFAGPALAAEDGSIRVSTDGLNLSDPRDVATLRARVDKAIARACTPHGSYFATLAPERDCLARVAPAAHQTIASLSAKAEKSRMAEF